MSNLIFLDLETTGLDPVTDSILEIGIVVYDTEARKATDEKSWVIFHTELTQYYDPYVQTMHTKNGLWAECLVSTLSLRDVEDEIVSFIKAQGPLSPMCGNSIHFDRAFLREHTERIEAAFHYRNLDVSTLNNIAQFFPYALMQAPKENAHRAVPDCFSSIRQLEFYLEQLEK